VIARRAAPSVEPANHTATKGITVNQVFSLALSAFACTAVSLSASAQRSIEDLAPDRSFAVMHCPSVRQAVARFKTSATWELMHSPDMREQVEPALEQLEQMISQFEAEMELEQGSLDFPAGPAGAAVFLAMNDEAGFELPAVLVTAQFTGQAEVLAKAMNMFVEHLNAMGEDVGEVEVAGRTLIAVSTGAAEAADALGDDDEMMMEGGFGDPQAIAQSLSTGFSTIYIGREDDVLIIGSHIPSLEQAFDAAAGGDIAAIGDQRNYRDAIAQVGEGDVTMVLVPGEMVGLAGVEPTMMFVLPVLSMAAGTLGLDGVEAIGLSADVAPDGALSASRLGILLDGPKKGIFALLDSATPVNPAPGFVGSSGGSYMRYNFEFNGMMGLVNALVRTVPPEVAPGLEDGLMQVGPDLETAFASLGPDLHLAPGGGAMVAAIRCTDVNSLSGVLNNYAPQAGMTPREFVGHTIFSSPDVPVALGVGAGHLFIGTEQGVEDALRAAGADNAGALASDESFRHALASIAPGDVVAWGYTEPGAMLTGAAMMQGLGGQFGMELPVEDVEAQIPDAEEIAKHIGPSVWDLRSVDTGFVMTFRTLKPAAR